MLSISSRFCLNQEATTHSKIKDTKKDKKIKAAHDKLSKSSPKHTFLRGTRKEQKQQTA